MLDGCRTVVRRLGLLCVGALVACDTGGPQPLGPEEDMTIPVAAAFKHDCTDPKWFDHRHCDGDDGENGDGENGDGENGADGPTIVLGGSYTTTKPQPAEYRDSGRFIRITAEDNGITMKYALADWPAGEYVGFERCTVVDVVGDPEDLWDEFLASSDADLKGFRTVVNRRAIGEPSGNHRTEGRWPTWDEAGMEDGMKFMWSFKAGTTRLRDENATATVEGDEITIAGGQLWIRKAHCGQDDSLEGCNPSGLSEEISCPNDSDTGLDLEFTVTVNR